MNCVKAFIFFCAAHGAIFQLFYTAIVAHILPLRLRFISGFYLIFTNRRRGKYFPIESGNGLEGFVGRSGVVNGIVIVNK